MSSRTVSDNLLENINTDPAAERKAFMDQKKADLEKWASDNRISTDILKQVIGHGPEGHGGMDQPEGPDDPADTN